MILLKQQKLDFDTWWKALLDTYADKIPKTILYLTDALEIEDTRIQKAIQFNEKKENRLLDIPPKQLYQSRKRKSQNTSLIEAVDSNSQ